MKTPTFEIEHQYWSQEVTMIAGVDEAGMGALAGPVVAAAVLFSPDSHTVFLEQTKTIPVRDSKLLSFRQREKAAEMIMKTAFSWGIGSASVEEITNLNIRNASHLAMRRAIDALTLPPDILLVDGNPARIHPTIFSVSLVKGDQQSYSIAAASILAKTNRDALMQQLDSQYPQYGFSSHKGYGSVFHLTALREHGPTPYHRPTYAPIASLTQ